MPQTRAIEISETGQLHEAELYGNEILMVEECIKGNRTARKVLYEKHYKMLLGICIRYVGNQPDAEDILHESFISIFRSISGFSFKSRIGSWMSRIVINDCLQFLRKKNKRIIEFTDDVPDVNNEEQVDAVILDKFSCDQIIELMDELPIGYRTVLCLYSIDGWSHKEIADKLGIVESTSRSQLAKARRMFNEILKSTGK